jgi:hypothetical protein
MTIDRHWLGDIALAILLALPLIAFARPHASVPKQQFASGAVHLATADRLPGNGRISLLG